jgi:hypothetical protein
MEIYRQMGIADKVLQQGGKPAGKGMAFCEDGQPEKPKLNINRMKWAMPILLYPYVVCVSAKQ